MSRGCATAVVGLGIFVVFFGLLFLVGSAGQGRRLAVAGIGLAAGTVIVGVGVRRYREAAARSPERIRAEILDLAKREDGEISREEISSLLGPRADAAPDVLDAMVLEGLCMRSPREGTFYFTFPDLQPRLNILRCVYCATEQALNSGLETCPNCGGPLALQVAVRSLSDGEVFSMDDGKPKPEEASGRQK